MAAPQFEAMEIERNRNLLSHWDTKTTHSSIEVKKNDRWSQHLSTDFSSMCYSFLADLNQLSPCESEPCVLCRRCFASFCVVYHPLFACSMCKCPCQLVFHSCLGNLQEDVNKDMFVDKLNLIITFFFLETIGRSDAMIHFIPESSENVSTIEHENILATRKHSLHMKTMSETLTKLCFLMFVRTMMWVQNSWNGCSNVIYY